jgi:hypothetical protein
MAPREKERSLREVESATYRAIISVSGFVWEIVSEVNWGRRGDIVARRTLKWIDTCKDRRKGRNAGSSGEWKKQLSVRDRVVIDRAEIFGCDVAGADKMVVVDRFNFLSFWNRSVKAILLVCGNFRA